MEDIDSFWTFHEGVDELKQKLQFMTYELEMTRNETNEEIRKNNEHIRKLLKLLQTACKERDEAKDELKKLQQIMAFNKKTNNDNVVFDHLMMPNSAFPATPFSPDSPLLTTNFATKTTSTITDSSSFSLETHNNNNNFNSHTQSHVSSPAASSPDSSNNIVFNTTSATKPTTTKVVDQEMLIMARLAKGRTLPQKGKLLQAVLEAGPLLSTLMVAGSLPQWRNPPGVLTHQIPPVNLKGCTAVVNQSSGGNKFCTSQLILPQVVGQDNVSTSFMKGMGNSTMYNGSFGVCPSPMLDFGNGSSGSCFMGGRMMINPGLGFDCQIPKRQRIV